MARMFTRLLLLLAMLFGVSSPSSGAENASLERQKIPTSLFIDSMADASRDDDSTHTQLAASNRNPHQSQPSARPNSDTSAAGHRKKERPSTLFESLKPYVSKDLVGSFKPTTFGFLNGTVQILTANFATIDADANQPNLFVRGELEQSINDSWSRLQRGEQPADAIDPYWQYYSDCDRWNVVFANAITSETPMQRFSLVSAAVEQLNSVRHWIVSGISPLESHVLNFAKQLEFNAIESRVYVSKPEPMAWIGWSQQQVHHVVKLSAGASKNGAIAAHRLSQQVKAAVDTAPNRYLVKLQQRRETDNLRRFVAPRLSWMASHLQQVADRLDYADHEASHDSKVWK